MIYMSLGLEIGAMKATDPLVKEVGRRPACSAIGVAELLDVLSCLFAAGTCCDDASAAFLPFAIGLPCIWRGSSLIAVGTSGLSAWDVRPSSCFLWSAETRCSTPRAHDSGQVVPLVESCLNMYNALLAYLCMVGSVSSAGRDARIISYFRADEMVVSPSRAAYVKIKQLIQIDHVSSGHTMIFWNDLPFCRGSLVITVSITALEALMQVCNAACEAGLRGSDANRGRFKVIVDS